MIGRQALRAADLGPFLLSFGLAIPLAALAERVAPLGVSAFEPGNDVVATAGAVWAGIELVQRRADPSRRRAWAFGLAGLAMIVAEDHLEGVLAALAPAGFLALSVMLWSAAAGLMLAFGRRFAMRRHVTTATRTGAALALFAAALAVALHAAPGIDHHHRLAKLQPLGELAATAAFVAALLLARFAPVKSYAFPAWQVGRQARALFYDFGLQTRVRYPAPGALFGLPPFRELLRLAIILRYWPVACRAVAREGGRGVWAQLADLLKVGLADGIDAKSYYVHDLYRAGADGLDATMTRVETKNGLNRRLQLLRADVGGPSDMNDKLAFWRTCEDHGIASAPIYGLVEDRAVDLMADRAALDRNLFVKQRKGRGGTYTLNFERVSPFLYRDDDGATATLDEILERLASASAGRSLMIQPKLANHASIASLADQALIVFRVMTCIGVDGEARVTHGVMRMLRRFEPNWPKTPDADWGCGIDLETGAFGLMTGDAPETCTRWFERHPVTGEQITGRLLDGWRDVAETALAAHRVFAARTLIGWDIGWTPDGAVILEGNSNPDFSYFQRVYRTPVGRSPLGPLLHGHLTALARSLVAREQEADAPARVRPLPAE